MYWRMTGYTVLTLVVALGLATLGYWQLSRAQAKQLLLDGIDNALAQPPAPLAVVLADPAGARFRKVEMDGRFLIERQILLDNQLRQGQPGVRVYVPFQEVQSGTLVLVDRGWQARADRSAPLPVAELDPGRQTLQGILVDLPGAGLALARDSSSDWPWLTPRMDPALLQQRLGPALLDYVLEEPVQGMAESVRAGMLPPERHRGYAVQWFGLAIAVLCIYLVLMWRQWQGRGARTPQESP